MREGNGRRALAAAVLAAAAALVVVLHVAQRTELIGGYAPNDGAANGGANF